jgi:hypothetical protein
MADQIVLATRKGTLILDRKDGRWTPRPIAHAGISVSYAARDPRDGTLWVAMDHAHWGPKLSRSKDDGRTWEHVNQIAYPKGARFVEQHLPTPDQDPSVERPTTYKQATLLKVWVLAFAGRDQPGTLYAGTLPGGLFISVDGGDTWELNRPLWNHPSRGGDLFAGDATSRNEWGGTPAAIAYDEFVPGITRSSSTRATRRTSSSASRRRACSRRATAERAGRAAIAACSTIAAPTSRCTSAFPSPPTSAIRSPHGSFRPRATTSA